MTVLAPWYLLGEIVPHLHTDMGNYQFYKIAPDGVMTVTVQWDLKDYSLEAVEEQLTTLWQGVDVLADRGVDRIVVAGVPVAAVMGRSRMRGLLKDAQERTGIPCDTTFEAHIAALRHLGAGEVALATRWSAELNEALTRYLADADIRVVACRFRGRNLAMNTVANPADDHELLLELGRQALEDVPDAPALLLPGGLGFVVHAARILEDELGVPVLTNVSSHLWAALHARDGDLPDRPDPRWGQLLRSL